MIEEDSIIQRNIDNFVAALQCEADGTTNASSRALMVMFLMRYQEMTMEEAKDLIKRLFDRRV